MHYASIILFDEEEPVTDGTGGVVLLDGERLAWLRPLNDSTQLDSEVVAERHCPYNTAQPGGTGICGTRIDACASGAPVGSSPGHGGSRCGADEAMVRGGVGPRTIAVQEQEDSR